MPVTEIGRLMRCQSLVDSTHGLDRSFCPLTCLKGLVMPMLPDRIPLLVKLGYSSFVAVLVPVYASNYGVANFLYFCDVALIMTLVAIWREDRLLVSMAAVGILAPQMLWLADYGAHFLGLKLTGMTDYMFDETKSRFLRGLSLFHGWLPLLLIWLVIRLGYDRRALKIWSMLSAVLLLVCYLFMPAPTPDAGNAAVNINYVHGMSDAVAQTWVHPLVWLAGLIGGLPLLLYLPTHLLLSRLIRTPPCNRFTAGDGPAAGRGA